MPARIARRSRTPSVGRRAAARVCYQWGFPGSARRAGDALLDDPDFLRFRSRCAPDRRRRRRGLASRVRSAGRMALDTEFLWERTYAPQLCLVQVAVGDHVALVDPIAARRSSRSPPAGRPRRRGRDARARRRPAGLRAPLRRPADADRRHADPGRVRRPDGLREPRAADRGRAPDHARAPRVVLRLEQAPAVADAGGLRGGRRAPPRGARRPPVAARRREGTPQLGRGRARTDASGRVPRSSRTRRRLAEGRPPRPADGEADGRAGAVAAWREREAGVRDLPRRG
jgi:hypothetical protein